MGQSHRIMKKAVSLIIQKTQTEMRYHSSAVRLTHIKQEIFIAMEGLRKQELILCCWGCKLT